MCIRDRREALRLLLHLVDSRHAPTALDREVMASVRPERYALVLTKGDKLSGNGRATSLKTAKATLAAHGLSHAPVVMTSSETGLGMDAVRAAIADAVGLVDVPTPE